MVQGSVPDRNRQMLGHRIPLPLDQAPSHVSAPFSPEMSQGWKPDSGRAWLPLRVGWNTSQTSPVSAPFSIEMVLGSAPLLGRRSQPFGSGIPLAPPDVLAFGIEMVQGSVPARARLFLGPRIPLPLDQVNHIPAPFGQEMVNGQGPSSPRPPFTERVGWSQFDLVLPQFQVEAYSEVIPQTSRVMLGVKIPLPYNEAPSHLDSPFSPEMTAGAAPSVRSRDFSKPQVGWVDNQTTPINAPFSVEMSQGSAPSSPRPPFLGKQGFFYVDYFNAVFNPEVYAKSLPDRARLTLGPRIGLPLSPAADNTPFPSSPEMMAGSFPDRKAKEFWHPEIGWQVTETTPVIPFEVEAYAQVQPSSPRLMLGPKIALPYNPAPSHVPVSFSVEMSAGVSQIRPLYHQVNQIGQPGAVRETIIFVFNVAWADGSNRVVGMEIEPE